MSVYSGEINLITCDQIYMSLWREFRVMRVKEKYCLFPSSWIALFTDNIKRLCWFFQCKGHLVPHSNPTAIACCDEFNLCNRNLRPTYVERSTTPMPGLFLTGFLSKFINCNHYEGETFYMKPSFPYFIMVLVHTSLSQELTKIRLFTGQIFALFGPKLPVNVHVVWTWPSMKPINLNDLNLTWSPSIATQSVCFSTRCRRHS